MNPSIIERDEQYLDMPVCQHLVPVKLVCPKCQLLNKLEELSNAIKEVCK